MGDSLAMTTLETGTTALTTDEMIAHIRPVVKGAPSPLVIGDLVFGSYNESLSHRPVHSSTRLIKEGGCDAVKLSARTPTLSRPSLMGIAVQEHLGLTPQTAVTPGRVQGPGEGQRSRAPVLDDAKRLEEAGVFLHRAGMCPRRVRGGSCPAPCGWPVIGIGAGRYCSRKGRFWCCTT